MSSTGRPRSPKRSRGFTLVEIAVVATIAVLLVGAALPNYQTRLVKVRRADAVLALTRVQMAQEQYRAVNGLYAGSLSLLRGAASPLSAEGLYDIELESSSAEAFGVVARARAGGLQSRDSDCPWLALRVDQGIAEQAPRAACWNR